MYYIPTSRCQRGGLTLKEAAEALPRDVVLHKVLPHFNPYRLSDLQQVLSLREVFVDTDGRRVRLISDEDLKECYFEGAWGFPKEDFMLANWQEMSLEEMKGAVRWAQPYFAWRKLDPDDRFIYPPCKVNVESLKTKEEIVRAYPELACVPSAVYGIAVAGAHALRFVKAGVVGSPNEIKIYLKWACHAGLKAYVIRKIAVRCQKRVANSALLSAVRGGHADVVDLLASEFGAEMYMQCLFDAVHSGQVAMIDLLVEKYGLDPDALGVKGRNALHEAVFKHGHCHQCPSHDPVRTIKHLIEKYNVDIDAMNSGGWTALDLAERFDLTECAAVLREYGATNGERWYSDVDSTGGYGSGYTGSDGWSDDSVGVASDDTTDWDERNERYASAF